MSKPTLPDNLPWRERPWRSLPTPFEGVSVCVAHAFVSGDDECLIQYRGTAPELLASGAMTAAALATPARSHARWDEDGHHCRLWKRLSGERMEFHRRVPFLKALKLPGVTLRELEEVRDDWLRRTGRAAEISVEGKGAERRPRPVLRLVVDNMRAVPHV